MHTNCEATSRCIIIPLQYGHINFKMKIAQARQEMATRFNSIRGSIYYRKELHRRTHPPCIIIPESAPAQGFCAPAAKLTCIE